MQQPGPAAALLLLTQGTPGEYRVSPVKVYERMAPIREALVLWEYAVKSLKIPLQGYLGADFPAGACLDTAEA